MTCNFIQDPCHSHAACSGDWWTFSFTDAKLFWQNNFYVASMDKL